MTFRGYESPAEITRKRHAAKRVEVTVIVRYCKGKSLGIWQGEYEPIKFRDGTSGQRELWHWLPVSQVERQTDVITGKEETISLPEWLATAKGFV